uniref:microtubule cross-linking factor 1-like isoform X2 n=1 Tax=Myxine glutinosa TaxID=7769 RepID=UPI00358FB2A0
MEPPSAAGRADGTRRRLSRPLSPARPQDAPPHRLALGRTRPPPTKVTVNAPGAAASAAPARGAGRVGDRGSPRGVASAGGIRRAQGRLGRHGLASAGIDGRRESVGDPGWTRPSDSGSDVSDSPSEHLSDDPRPAAPGSDADSPTGSSDAEPGRADRRDPPAGEASGAKRPWSSARSPEPRLGLDPQTGSGVKGGRACGTENRGILKGEKPSYKEMVRDAETLRTENTYLKDELEELRAEMEEMRDGFLEEDVQQLQELRRELDRSYKTCRILQYRLRKVDRRGVRTTQAGYPDEDAVRGLEQDLKVAKDVSVRLHQELEAVEEKRGKVEDENEALRQKLLELEIAKQALQKELEKGREALQKRRTGRDLHRTDRKSGPQEDAADLQCQVQLLREEASLMRKKMVHVGRERDCLERDLENYKSVYGDLRDAKGVGSGPSDPTAPPGAREAELRLRLGFLEEEASILGRKVVQLEVENRGLHAELDEGRSGQAQVCDQAPSGTSHAISVAVEPTGEGSSELRRQLQFVEEEAEVLRRAVSEAEEQNQQLVNELNRCKSCMKDNNSSQGESESRFSAGSALEELRMGQANFSKHVIKASRPECKSGTTLSNEQNQELNIELDGDGEQAGDSDGNKTPSPQPPQRKREGPIGGESIGQHSCWEGSSVMDKIARDQNPTSMELKALRDELHRKGDVRGDAEGLGRTIDRLVADTDVLLVGGQGGFPQAEVLERVKANLKEFRLELRVFLERLRGEEGMPEGDKGSVTTSQGQSDSGLSPLSWKDTASFLTTETSTSGEPTSTQSEVRKLHANKEMTEEPCWKLQAEVPGAIREYDNELCSPELTSDTGQLIARELWESQQVLAEAQESIAKLNTQVEQEQNLRREDTWKYEQSIVQLKEDHQRALQCRDFRVQSLQLQWRLERQGPKSEGPLALEAHRLQQLSLGVCIELRRLLRHWRLGRRFAFSSPGYLQSERVGELGALVMRGDLWLDSSERSAGLCKEAVFRGVPEWDETAQAGDSRQLALELSTVVEDLQAEARGEVRRRCQMQQQYAGDRATWEIERSELRLQMSQLEGRATKGPANKVGAVEVPEEQRRRLAELHISTMELRHQLDACERLWTRERLDLLQRFNRERGEWEQQRKKLQQQLEQLHKQRQQHRRHGESRLCRNRSLDDAEQVDTPCGQKGSRFVEALLVEPLERHVEVLGQSDVKAQPLGKRKSEPDKVSNQSTLRRVCSVSCMAEFETLMDKSPFLPAEPNRPMSPLSPNEGDIAELGRTSDTRSPQVAATTWLSEPWDMLSFDPADRSLPTNMASKIPRPGHDSRIECPRMVSRGGLKVQGKDTRRRASHLSPHHGTFSDLENVAALARGAVRSRSLERPTHDAACQACWKGREVATQTLNSSIDHQSTLRTTAISASPLRRNGGGRGGIAMISSPCRTPRKVAKTPTSPVQTRFERPCCSPKYGSPRLQRKPPPLRHETSGPASSLPHADPSSPQLRHEPMPAAKPEHKACAPMSPRLDPYRSRGDPASPRLAATQRLPVYRQDPSSLQSPRLRREPCSPKRGGIEVSSPARVRQQNESAWARSTTTRDSPVHSPSDESSESLHSFSSLFSFIDHTPTLLDTVRRFGLGILKSSRDKALQPRGPEKAEIWPGDQTRGPQGCKDSCKKGQIDLEDQARAPQDGRSQDKGLAPTAAVPMTPGNPYKA